MNGEFISVDGKPVPVQNCGAQLSELMKVNYTYRYLHVTDHKPLHLSTQAALLDLSFGSLYGTESGLSDAALARSVDELLYRSGAPRGSNLVKAVLYPGPDDGRPHTVIFYEGPMIYSGYTLWHRQFKALPLTYETPFPAYKTAAAYNAHLLSAYNARRKGCDAAITVNYAGEAVSAGEHPLFTVMGRDVFTADALTSVPQTTERLLGIELCSHAGLTVHETAVPVDRLPEMDELFTVTPQGLVPIGSAAGKLYPSSVVKVLEGYLGEMALKEFALE